MKPGIDFYTWSSMIIGTILALIGHLLWFNNIVKTGELLIAIGAGFILLGFIILMTNMILTMSAGNIQNIKGKRGGPL